MADIVPITNLRGPAARIVEVTAETIPAGQAPEVIMTGLDQARRFHFKNERGLPGVNAVENDAAVAAYVGAMDSDTRAALAAAIAEETVPVDDGEAVMTALDQRRSGVIAVISDSTGYKNSSGNYVGTDGNEWPKQLALALAARYPTCEVGYHALTSALPVEYGPREVLSSGVGSVTVFADTFDRTAAELVGTTPNTGGAWAGTTGEFSLPGDGTATRIAGSTSKNATAVGQGRMRTVFDITFDTQAASGNVLCIGSRPNGTTYMMLRVLPASDTVEAVVVYNNVSTTVNTFTFAEAGIAATGVVNATLTIDHQASQQVTFKVGPATYLHALTAPEEAAYQVANSVGISASAAGTKFRTITATMPIVADHVLDVYNASMGSRDAQWATANIDALLPVKPDVAIIPESHNHEGETPEVYLASMDALVAAIWALWDKTVGIIPAGQNPQYSPSADPAAHQARQAVLRRYAKIRGFGYMPVFEAFMALPIPKALVRSDGVHPTPEGIDLIGATAIAHMVALSDRPD